MCKKGIGVAFVPFSFVKKEIENGELSVISKPPFEYKRKLYICYKKNITLSSGVKFFLDNLLNKIKNYNNNLTLISNNFKILEQISITPQKNNQEKVEMMITSCLIKRFGINYVSKIYSKKLIESKIDNIKYDSKYSFFREYNKELFTNSTYLNNINFNWLKYYVKLAESRDFEIATKELEINIKTLQKIISTIENKLDTKLIKGKTKFKGLTFAGKVFYKQARKIIKEIYNIYEIIELKKSEEKKLCYKIGWLSTSYIDILVDSIENIKKKYSEVTFKIYFNSYEEFEKKIEIGEIDLALVVTKPYKNALRYINKGNVPYIIASKTKQNDVSWRELRYLGISTKVDPDYNDFFVANYDVLGADKVISWFPFQIFMEFCKEGFGSCFISKSSILKELKEKELQEVAESPIHYSFSNYLIYNENNTDPIINELIDVIDKHKGWTC